MSDILRKDNDFYVEAGDFVLSSGGEVVVQRVIERLKSLAGEWFLDAEGIPYLSEIWGKNVSYRAIHAILLDTVVQTPGVSFIEKFNILLDTETRNFKVELSFRTIENSLEHFDLFLQEPADRASRILDTLSGALTDTSRDFLRDTRGNTL